MKTISLAVLGLSLTLATAGVSFAAQATNAPASSSITAAKKHVKKNKKSSKTAASNTATPAPAATK